MCWKVMLCFNHFPVTVMSPLCVGRWKNPSPPKHGSPCFLLFQCCVSYLYVTILEGIANSNMGHQNSNTAGIICRQWPYRCVEVFLQTFSPSLSYELISRCRHGISTTFLLWLLPIRFLPCPLCGYDYQASAKLFLCFQSWAMLPVACLCSISSVYHCKGKPTSYPEVPLTAIINSGINFSTGHCSVWAELSWMDSVFDILHEDSLFPKTFPKQCWTNYFF